MEMVTFDLSEHHYAERSALYDVSFAGTDYDDSVQTALDQVKSLFGGRTINVSTNIGMLFFGYMRASLAFCSSSALRG